MNEPLSSSQQQLHGRDVRDMTVVQLRDWIEACATMERLVKAAKARRNWKKERETAADELAMRSDGA